MFETRKARGMYVLKNTNQRAEKSSTVKSRESNSSLKISNHNLRARLGVIPLSSTQKTSGE